MASGSIKWAALADGKPTCLTVGGEPVVIVRDGEEVFALRDVCSHAEVALSEGEVVGRSIECWLHGSRFDLATGEPSGPPAFEAVPTYDTQITIDHDGDRSVVVTTS